MVKKYNIRNEIKITYIGVAAKQHFSFKFRLCILSLTNVTMKRKQMILAGTALH